METSKIINTNVSMGNDLVTLPLKNFTASEMDIFLAICYRCQRQGSTELRIPVSELRQIAKYKNVSNKELMDAVELTGKKITSLSFTIKKTNTHFSIFIPFTVFDHESVSLSSSYSKCIYKMLRRFRNTPKPCWIVTMEDFRQFTDVPESYSTGNIVQRVLDPSIKELTPFFPNLKVEKLYSNVGKRGRPSVSGLKFTFDKRGRSNNPDYETLGISVLDEPYI